MAYVKLILSGDLVEEYEYELSPNPDRLKRTRKPRRRVFTVERRADSIKACRRAFSRLVRANLETAPALATLTIVEVGSISDAYREYTLFGKRMRTMFGKDLRMIAVPEFQKRGAVHFHVLIWGLPSALPCLFSKSFYFDATGKRHRKHICPVERACERNTRTVANIWARGYVDIVETDGSPKLSTYLAKYMQKAMHDVRLVGKRAYSATRNVLRPLSLNTSFQVAYARDELIGDNTLDSLKEYDTLFLGRCVYKRYLIKSYEGSESPIDVA